jgi:MFS transporter, PPP family, 3-phenylpropionic acid transporter
MTEKARGTLAIRLYYVAAVAVGGVYLPFFPRWLEGRGVFGARLGVVAAAAPAMAVVAPSAFGALADAMRWRGGLLQAACAGALVTFGSVAAMAAAGWPLGFGVLLASALCFALFRSPMGFVADIVAIELAAAAGTTYGRIRLWGSLGFIVTVPVATRYLDPLAAAGFPIVVTAIVLGALLASLRLPRHAELPGPRDRGDRRGARELVGDADFALFLVAVFLGQCGHAAYDLCFSFRLLELHVPKTTFWVAWDLGTAAEVVMMAYSAPLFREFPAPTLFAFALGAASLRWCALAVVRSPAVLLALQPLHALSFGLAWLASVGYASHRFPRHSIGSAQGLFVTATGAGSALGMIAWGSLYHRAGGAAVFAGAACFSGAACAFAVALDRRGRDRAAAEAATGE